MAPMWWSTNHTLDVADSVVTGIKSAGGSASAIAADVTSQAEFVAFLASDPAGWVTGQNIRVNGGTA